MTAKKKSASVLKPIILKKYRNVIFSKMFFFNKMLSGILAVVVLLLTQPVSAAEINLISAEEVAANFITYLGDNHTHTIRETDPVEQSGQNVGYLVNLNPQGYILVAGDTIRVPVKAYSLTSDFINLPPAYVRTLLNELQISEILPLKIPEALSSNSMSARTTAAAPPEETNRSYWEFLTQTTILSKKKLRNYTPDTCLLTTKWNQGYPYNKFNPKAGEDLTLTGCVQTAVGQVMRYHAHPSSGSGVFEHTWNGQTLTAVMNRPFNWSAMPDSLDILNGSVEQYQQEEVAALMRDLGILNEANFGTGATSAAFHSVNFERAFGYAPISTMDSDNDNFFTTIVSEINNQRPLLLAMPDHMVVADGYASDGSGKKIHLNMGWGGTDDNYYYLDQTIVTENNSFAPNHTIYYNIQPCQGGECNPDTSDDSGNPPVIGSDLNDMVINNTNTLRIETYDPDGDTVTLSATSSCNSLQPSLSANLLTLTPGADNIFCEVTIEAQSSDAADGTADKTFQVLVLEDMIHIGTQYDIGGEFSNGTEVDEYSAWLEGNTTLSGNRGYSNQAFFIWIKDNNGNIVMPASETSISDYLTAGLYTIAASLKNPSGNNYYNYDADFSGYSLTVTCSDLNQSVSDLADSMGIELSNDNNTPEPPELPESVTSYQILTDQSGLFTIQYGEYVKVIGSAGINTIYLESGARVECLNFAGANVVDIEDAASNFTVYRSGAMVYLESAATGIRIKIAVNSTEQTLRFADGTSTLRISDGKVKIGEQEIKLTETQLTSPDVSRQVLIGW